MPTIEEMAANLPDPKKDKMPPQRILTEAEVREIKAKKREEKTGRRDWSNKAEQMMCRILEGAFNAANVQRIADRMQGWQDKEGEWHYSYANYAKPDINFAVVYDGQLMDGVMEVKSCAPSSSGMSIHNFKPWQMKQMDKARGKLRLWGLVFWEAKGQARCFVVGHERLKKVLNEDLPRRARHDGRFQGASIRRKKDLDLIADCEVLKTNRWYLPEGHWFDA